MSRESSEQVIKVDKPIVDKAEPSIRGKAVPFNTMLVACILGYCVPGVGHMFLGRKIRGLIFMVTIFLMFGLGLVMHGHIYTPNMEDKLSIFPTFANLGVGLAYFTCYMFHMVLNINLGFGPPQAAASTFEYGNTFLWTAGLLNYLVMLDVYDIAIGRKR